MFAIHPQTLEGSVDRDFLDGFLSLLAKCQVPEEDRAVKAKSVHVLAGCGIDLAGPGQHGALGLGLGGGDDVGNAHQLQELLTLGIVLSGDSDGSPRKLLHILGSARLLGFLEVFACLGLALKPLGELAGLELGGGTVEDVEGLDAVVDHAEGAVEHAHQVGGGVARLVRQLLAIGSDGDEETVDAHGAGDGQR